MLRSQISIEVAGVVVSGRSRNGELFYVDEAYRSFASLCDPDLILVADYDHIPEVYDPDTQVFDSDGLWTLSRNPQEWIWRFRSPSLDPTPKRLSLFSPDFRAGNIYFDEIDIIGGGLPMPFFYPLDRFLFTSLISDVGGIMLHACGLIVDGSALLFVGPSESGKSTTAMLWNKHEDVTVLSDERVVARKQFDRYRLYGTPWYGTAGLYSPQSSLLKAMFFLKQGSMNEAVQLGPMQAVASLSRCVFWPAWRPAGMNRVLQSVADMVQCVPCFELSFTPDVSAVSYVQDFLQGFSDGRV
jgi:hypothetical protein